MLATLTEKRFSDENWIFERKLDGVRTIASRDGGTPALWSRNQKVMNAAYPEIVNALAEHGGPRFVVDGEAGDLPAALATPLGVVLTELLKGAGYQDTPANRQVLEDAMRKLGVKLGVDVATELGKP